MGSTFSEKFEAIAKSPEPARKKAADIHNLLHEKCWIPGSSDKEQGEIRNLQAQAAGIRDLKNALSHRLNMAGADEDLTDAAKEAFAAVAESGLNNLVINVRTALEGTLENIDDIQQQQAA